MPADEWTEADLGAIRGKKEALDELKPLLANMAAAMAQLFLVTLDAAQAAHAVMHTEKLHDRMGQFSLAWGQFCIRNQWNELVPPFMHTREETDGE